MHFQKRKTPLHLTASKARCENVPPYALNHPSRTGIHFLHVCVCLLAHGMHERPVPLSIVAGFDFVIAMQRGDPIFLVRRVYIHSLLALLQGLFPFVTVTSFFIFLFSSFVPLSNLPPYLSPSSSSFVFSSPSLLTSFISLSFLSPLFYVQYIFLFHLPLPPFHLSLPLPFTLFSSLSLYIFLPVLLSHFSLSLVLVLPLHLPLPSFFPLSSMLLNHQKQTENINLSIKHFPPFCIFLKAFHEDFEPKTYLVSSEEQRWQEQCRFLAYVYCRQYLFKYIYIDLDCRHPRSHIYRCVFIFFHLVFFYLLIFIHKHIYS